jgi:DNA-binding NarL/FixJ family response regulator
MNLRKFIFDDSEDRIESLKALLSLNDDYEIVGEANNCTNSIQLMETKKPIVVLMDINMPEVVGLEGLKLIKTSHPEIKVLMQTAFDDSDKIFTSIKNGASGYILKTDKPNRILQAIEEVNQGGAVMNPNIAQKVLEHFTKKSVEIDSILSNRERGN